MYIPRPWSRLTSCLASGTTNRRLTPTSKNLQLKTTRFDLQGFITFRAHNLHLEDQEKTQLDSFSNPPPAALYLLELPCPASRQHTGPLIWTRPTWGDDWRLIVFSQLLCSCI